MRTLLITLTCFLAGPGSIQLGAQMKWQLVDTGYGQLPPSVRLFRSADPIDGQPSVAYYLEADLKDPRLEFTTDTTYGRRFTPSEFAARNGQPLAVVNTTFFSFETNQNLGLVIRDGKLLSYNVNSVYSRADSQYHYVLPGTFGIRKNRKADIANTFTDSSRRRPYTITYGVRPVEKAKANPRLKDVARAMPRSFARVKKKWKMQTAVAGGPVLLQKGELNILNNQERKFMGRAIDDRHPRTAIGYTADDKMIILVIEGRRPGVAEGATLTQEAMILKDLGCIEALNLDGGGSSCLLVNGRETIRPSDQQGNQRPVPAVLLIRQKD